MRPAPWLLAEPHRVQADGFRSRYGDDYGVFEVRSPISAQMLRIMANAANEFSHGWEHVSVSLPGRCPNWPEMDYVRGLFWRDDETVMQLHVPRDEHISMHPNCLHLWRPTFAGIPRPPASLVA